MINKKLYNFIISKLDDIENLNIRVHSTKNYDNDFNLIMTVTEDTPIVSSCKYGVYYEKILTLDFVGSINDEITMHYIDLIRDRINHLNYVGDNAIAITCTGIREINYQGLDENSRHYYEIKLFVICYEL